MSKRRAYILTLKTKEKTQPFYSIPSILVKEEKLRFRLEFKVKNLLFSIFRYNSLMIAVPNTYVIIR